MVSGSIGPGGLQAARAQAGGDFPASLIGYIDRMAAFLSRAAGCRAFPRRQAAAATTAGRRLSISSTSVASRQGLTT